MLVFMKQLHERVGYVLAQAGRTATDIAKDIGVSPEAIIQWASGATKNIRPENLFPFADATGFEARWIGTGEGPERPLYKKNSPVGHALAVMEQMSAPYQAQAVRQIDSLAELAKATGGNGTDG